MNREGDRGHWQIPVVLFWILFIAVSEGCRQETGQEPGPSAAAGVEQAPFDRARWAVKQGKEYPFRESMVQALVYTDTLRALKEPELLDLLGTPDRASENHLYYMISQTRLGPWPLHSRFLVIKLNPGQAVEWVKIHE